MIYHEQHPGRTERATSQPTNHKRRPALALAGDTTRWTKIERDSSETNWNSKPVVGLSSRAGLQTVLCVLCPSRPSGDNYCQARAFVSYEFTQVADDERGQHTTGWPREGRILAARMRLIETISSLRLLLRLRLLLHALPSLFLSAFHLAPSPGGDTQIWRSSGSNGPSGRRSLSCS